MGLARCLLVRCIIPVSESWWLTHLKFTHQRNQNEAKQQNLWNEKQNTNRNLERKNNVRSNSAGADNTWNGPPQYQDSRVMWDKMARKWRNNKQKWQRLALLRERGKREKNGWSRYPAIPEARKSMLQWNPISDRIITVRMKTSVRKITIVRCYAPPNVAEHDLKEKFYGELLEVIRHINKGDVTIVMGDQNA